MTLTTIETAAPTTGAAPSPAPLFPPRPFPTCAPWCTGEHWDGDNPDDPGVCFAGDVEVPYAAGEVSAAMSFDPRRTENGRPDYSITVFVPSRDITEGLNVTDLDEAEIAAYTLLAQIAVARGDQAQADRHHLAALDAAKRGGGAPCA